MRTIILLAPALLVAGGLAAAQDLAGDWHGAVEVANDAPLRLALHITRDHTATLDSIDEGAMGLRVDSINRDGSLLKFELQSLGGAYQGEVAEDGSVIRGWWKQDGGTWPLNWERGEDPADTPRLFDADRARQGGRACARVFYGGRLSELWRRLAPVMRQAMGSEAGLREFRQRSLGQLGSETAISSESVRTEGVLQIYRRVARFAKSRELIEVRFAFNAQGNVTEICVHPAPSL